MKKISKKMFDSVLRMTRKYWKTGDKDIVIAKIAVSEDLKRETGIDWLAFSDLADCILMPHGFKPSASNDTIYAVLNVLGYEVMDDEEQTSQSL